MRATTTPDLPPILRNLTAWLAPVAVATAAWGVSTLVFAGLAHRIPDAGGPLVWRFAAAVAAALAIVLIPALLAGARDRRTLAASLERFRKQVGSAGPSAPFDYDDTDFVGCLLREADTVRGLCERYEARHFEDTKLVAETREAMREIRTLSEAAEAASRAKSQFLANMSHELRTPLNAIIGFSELLSMRRGGDLSDAQRRYVDHIMTSGRHLLSLINDVLDLSKVEAGKMEMHAEEFVFEEVVSETLGIVRDMVRAKSIQLHTELPGAMPPILADKKKVRQILLNLLSNAVKFTPPRGEIGVRVGFFRNGDETSGTLEVAVWDTGPGIPPDHRSKIFREFHQVDASYTREQEGTGLGLALSRKLVEMHGGRIWFETEVGAGTTFSFSIPQEGPHPAEHTAAEQPPRETPQWDPEDEIKKQLPTVLLVERSRARIDTLEDLLTREGFQVAIADTPETALRKARELRPIAMIVNILLTRKTGWQILKDLQKDPVMRTTPIIFVADIDERHINFSLGAIAYIEKTVQSDHLLAYVENLRNALRQEDGFSVLIIDDDPLVTERVYDLLTPKGINVHHAATGKDGIALAQKLRPSVIFLDLILPDLDGFEVAARLRAHPATKAILLLVFTAGDFRTENLVRLGSSIFGVARQGILSHRDFLRDLELIRRLSETATKELDEERRTAEPAGMEVSP